MNLSDKSISPASDPSTRRDEVGETGLAALPLRCAERLCLSGPTPTHTCWQGCALPASVSERSVFGKVRSRELRDYYGQALPLRRAVGDRTGEVITLHNIGTAYHDLGQKQKALEYFGQALPRSL